MHLQHRGDATCRLPLIYQFSGKSDLLGRQDRGTAEPNALCLRCGSTAAGAIVDQGPFELGNAGKDRQHHASGRRRGVGPWLCQRTQAGLGRIQLLGNIEKITGRAGEAIEPGDGYNITVAQLIEQRCELRPIAPGSRHLFFKNTLTPRRLQRCALLV